MIRKLPHLLSGLALLAVGCYMLRRPLTIWQPPWRSESVHTADAIDLPAPGADGSDAANVKAYGVISTLMDKAKEVTGNTDAPSGRRLKLEVDRTDSSDALAPKRFLHRRFTLKSSHGFTFEVPPHATRPRIHGIFTAFVGDSSGPSRRPENVEILLFNEEEFRDFMHGRGQASTDAASPSPGAVIDWTLESTLRQPLKYYLVFRNASTEHRAEQVDADFTVSFD